MSNNDPEKPKVSEEELSEKTRNLLNRRAPEKNEIVKYCMECKKYFGEGATPEKIKAIKEGDKNIPISDGLCSDECREKYLNDALKEKPE